MELQKAAVCALLRSPPPPPPDAIRPSKVGRVFFWPLWEALGPHQLPVAQPADAGDLKPPRRALPGRPHFFAGFGFFLSCLGFLTSRFCVLLPLPMGCSFR